MRPEQIIDNKDTIIALATPPGHGAIGVLRISGEEAISVTNQVFKGKDLSKQETHTIHFGTIRDGKEILDEVLVALFVAPQSYTGENSVEISFHGSSFIASKIITLFNTLDVRYARPGEFTQRAFLNGKLDLAQAEAVSDLITSDSESSHKAAMNQMRGGFSSEIKALREKLIHFASLIELELDFGEEDVEFADRQDLKDLILELQSVVKRLIDSFALGNVIKNGVPTVIAGKPNAGKSTLLNALLNEEKAIVSEIAGTTRDFIEDEVNIEGINFRFIDTAGLRETEDQVEAIGVRRTYEKMKQASLIIYMFDTAEISEAEFSIEKEALLELGIPYLLVANKLDLVNEQIPDFLSEEENIIGISAKQVLNIESLKDKLFDLTQLDDFRTGNTIVTNARHHDNLMSTQKALVDVMKALNTNMTGDFLALDIRQALHYLGEITGEITTDDLLDNIFSKFCIGK